MHQPTYGTRSNDPLQTRYLRAGTQRHGPGQTRSQAMRYGLQDVPWQESLPVLPISILMTSMGMLLSWGCFWGGPLCPVLRAMWGLRTPRAVMLGVVALLSLAGRLAWSASGDPPPPPRLGGASIGPGPPSLPRLGSPTLRPKSGRPDRSGDVNIFDPGEASMLPVIPLGVAGLFFLCLLGFVVGGAVGTFISMTTFVFIAAAISALDIDEDYAELQRFRIPVLPIR